MCNLKGFKHTKHIVSAVYFSRAPRHQVYVYTLDYNEAITWDEHELLPLTEELTTQPATPPATPPVKELTETAPPDKELTEQATTDSIEDAATPLVVDITGKDTNDPLKEPVKVFKVGERVSTGKIAAIKVVAVHLMSDGTFVYTLENQLPFYHGKDLEKVLSYEDKTHRVEFHLLEPEKKCALLVTSGKETHYFHISDSKQFLAVLEQFVQKLRVTAN